MNKNGAPTREDSNQIQLIKWKVLMLTQYEHLKSYNSTIHTETSLTAKGKEKMKALMDKILVKLEATISDIKKTLKPSKIKSAQLNNARYKIIAQEVEALQYQIDKICATTETLSGIKQKWTEELSQNNLANEDYLQINSEEEKIEREEPNNVEMAKSEYISQNVSDNQYALRSEITNEVRSKSVSQNPKMNLPKDKSISHANLDGYQPQLNNPIEAVISEFADVKSVVNKLKISFNEHKHFQYENKLDKLSNVLLKLESEHGIIQNEMSELLHTVHKLTQRVEQLEDDSIRAQVNKSKLQPKANNDPYLTYRNEVEEKPTYTDAKIYAHQQKEMSHNKSNLNEKKPFLISHRTNALDNYDLSEWAKKKIESESIQANV